MTSQNRPQTHESGAVPDQGNGAAHDQKGTHQMRFLPLSIHDASAAAQTDAIDDYRATLRRLAAHEQALRLATQPAEPEPAPELPEPAPELMEADTRFVDGATITTELWHHHDQRTTTSLTAGAYELDRLTPAQCREIAAQLLECANAAEGGAAVNGPQIAQLPDDELHRRVRQFDRAARAAHRRPDIPNASEVVTVAALLRLEQRRRADEREIAAAIDVINEGVQA